MKEKYVKALMDMTVRFGETSTAKRLKVGCIIYKNDSIIALGTNGQPPTWHSEECEDTDGVTLPSVRHAEAAALEKLYLSTETSVGATVFVSHAPCLQCATKLVAAKVDKVFYKNEYKTDDGLQYLKSRGIVVFKLN